MPEDPSDPPRKFYAFKPRDFERVNAPAGNAPSQPAPPKPAEPDPSRPVDVHELHRHAAVPGPVLSSGNRGAAENDVHAILRDNLARANAAGLNQVSLERKKKSRRTRDYIILIIAGDGLLGVYAFNAFHAGNVPGFVAAVAGVGAFTAAITWIIWFIMDRY